MSIDALIYPCDHCGKPTLDVESIFRRLREWPDVTDETALVMLHGVIHTCSAQLRAFISPEGTICPWDARGDVVNRLAASSAASACWMLLSGWPGDPLDVQPEVEWDMASSTDALLRVQSRVMVHLGLHEWAKPPAGDRA